MFCTTFRPAGYLQRGDRAAFNDDENNQVEGTVISIDTVKMMVVVSGDLESYLVPLDKLRRVA